MAAPGRLDALRCACENWWQDIRKTLPARVAAHVRGYLNFIDGDDDIDRQGNRCL
jgi:hypothetical protein